MAIFLILSSCDPMAEIYDELEKEKKDFASEFSRELNSGDYAAIADLTSNSDASWFIEDNEAFSEEFPISNYLPPYLEDLYPALGESSVGKITYNMFTGYPEYLDDYTAPERYFLDDEDYNSIGGDNQVYKTFIGDDKPEDHIPGFLEAEYPDAAESDIVLALYKYAEEIKDPSVIYTMASSDYQLIVDHVEADIDPQYVNFYGTGEVYYGADAYFNNFSARVSDRIMDITAEGDTVWVEGFDGLTVAEKEALIDARIQEAIVHFLEQTYPAAVPEVNGQTVYYNIRYSTFDGSGHTYYVVYECTAAGPPATFQLVDGPSEDYLVYSNTVKEDRGDYYLFDGNEWDLMDNIYYLSSADYNEMGDPGNYDNFSSSVRPENYIPRLLDDKYPYAQNGEKTAVAYKYYSGSVGVRAMEFVYDNGWTAYDPYEVKEAQFIHNGVTWVFDPTVMFTMGGSDFQMVVDYVGDNVGSNYVDSYGTSEFYTGASAYYNNFDIRSGSYEEDVFASWEEAVEWAIGEALLPTKYPDAVTEVSGIPVHFIVTFPTYSGVDGLYSMEFEVTKAGPDPEFALVSGPVAE